jgi:hypothetical protein
MTINDEQWLPPPDQKFRVYSGYGPDASTAVGGISFQHAWSTYCAGNPLFMTLVNNVAENWAEDDDNDSNQGEENAVDDQHVVLAKGKRSDKETTIRPITQPISCSTNSPTKYPSVNPDNNPINQP